MQRQGLLYAVLLAALVSSHSLAADEHPLARAGTGDYATYTIQMQFAGLSVNGTITQTVTAKSDKEATVKVTGTINYMGNEQAIPPQEQKVDLTKPYDPTRIAGPLPAGADVKVDKGKEGQEAITIGGKKYECAWTEYKLTTQVGGMTMVADAKVWMCREVPLGIVKMSLSSNQGGQKMEVKLELKETGKSK